MLYEPGQSTPASIPVTEGPCGDRISSSEGRAQRWEGVRAANWHMREGGGEAEVSGERLSTEVGACT